MAVRIKTQQLLIRIYCFLKAVQCILKRKTEHIVSGYYGFAVRDYLVINNIALKNNSSVMEIGVGTGSTIGLIMGKVKKYCGVDISSDLIDWLHSVYSRTESVRFCVIDVCGGGFLGEKFDVIISADTLEHVQSPQGYFDFIAKHLSSDGIALVTFPNESEEKHHGVTWFKNKKELFDLVDSSGLKVLDVKEVLKTICHRLIKNILWSFPKYFVSRRVDSMPQSFEDTEAFQINKVGGIKAEVFGCYARTVTLFAQCFQMYNLVEVNGEHVSGKILLMHLKHKST